MHDRIVQMNDLIRDILGRILIRDLALKQGVLLTISKVETTRNLRATHVSVSVYPVTERDYALKTLGHELHSLEVTLHRELSTRPLPKLFFKLDVTSERADEIEHLLRAVKNENESSENPSL